MNNALRVFQYEERDVRAVTGSDGEPWFVAADVALRGEVDEVACAISVGDMTGPHGYAAELPQVAAVAIKALMGYVMQTHVAK